MQSKKHSKQLCARNCGVRLEEQNTVLQGEIMQVYKAINAVQAELSVQGIAKNQRNGQGTGYNFRGIDDVLNALSPLLSKHGLCILPRVLARECVERQSKNGGALFYITVEVEFDFVSSEDGTKHTVKTFGEAMDSGDKATNKAMSAAYKYACFQAFSIPTEAKEDADYQTHEVKPTLTNARFAQAVERIKEGKYTTDKLRDTFSLTQEQEDSLIGALANAE
jgi:hypothetical protein